MEVAVTSTMIISGKRKGKLVGQKTSNSFFKNSSESHFLGTPL
jgi:hypothetical protein